MSAPKKIYLTLREADQGEPLPDGFYSTNSNPLLVDELEIKVKLLVAAIDSLGYLVVFSDGPEADEDEVGYININRARGVQ